MAYHCFTHIIAIFGGNELPLTCQGFDCSQSTKKGFLEPTTHWVKMGNWPQKW